MGFGGPVWHASIAPVWRGVLVEPEIWTLPYQVLRGVGDAVLGEWREVGDKAVHLRRRLTPRETKQAGIDAVVDVRGTADGAARIARMRAYLPAAMQSWPDTAFP